MEGQGAACHRVGWGSRLLGLAVLALAVAAGFGLALSGGAPAWTWGVLLGIGLAAATASLANFGERLHVDEGGLRHENVVLRRVRTARWDQVLRAVDHEGRTWFLEVEGQARWVLDQLDGHDVLRLEFQARGIPVEERRMPRLWDRGPRAGT